MQKPVAISYGIFAALLVLVALLHLGTPFLAALFCYLALNKLAFWGKRWLAVTLFIALMAAAFVGFTLAPVIGDPLLRAEVGYAGAAALLCTLLWGVHRRTPYAGAE